MPVRSTRGSPPRRAPAESGRPATGTQIEGVHADGGPDDRVGRADVALPEEGGRLPDPRTRIRGKFPRKSVEHACGLLRVEIDQEGRRSIVGAVAAHAVASDSERVLASTEARQRLRRHVERVVARTV